MKVTAARAAVCHFVRISAHTEKEILSKYLTSHTDQSTRALKDELPDDELDGVTGGLVVIAIIAILIGYY